MQSCKVQSKENFRLLISVGDIEYAYFGFHRIKLLYAEYLISQIETELSFIERVSRRKNKPVLVFHGLILHHAHSHSKFFLLKRSISKNYSIGVTLKIVRKSTQEFSCILESFIFILLEVM